MTTTQPEPKVVAGDDFGAPATTKPAPKCLDVETSAAAAGTPTKCLDVETSDAGPGATARDLAQQLVRAATRRNGKQLITYADALHMTTTQPEPKPVDVDRFEAPATTKPAAKCLDVETSDAGPGATARNLAQQLVRAATRRNGKQLITYADALQKVLAERRARAPGWRSRAWLAQRRATCR